MKQSLISMIEFANKKPILSAVPAAKRILLTEARFRSLGLSETVDTDMVIGYCRLFISCGVGKDSLLAQRAMDLLPAGHPFLLRRKTIVVTVDNDLHTSADVAQSILDSALSLACAVAAGEVKSMKTVTNSMSWIICGLALIGGAELADKIEAEIHAFCVAQPVPELPDPEKAGSFAAMLACLAALSDTEDIERERCKACCDIILKGLGLDVDVSDVTEACMEVARAEMRKQNELVV